MKPTILAIAALAALALTPAYAGLGDLTKAAVKADIKQAAEAKKAEASARKAEAAAKAEEKKAELEAKKDALKGKVDEARRKAEETTAEKKTL